MLDNCLDSLKENENPDYEIDEELENKVDNLVSKIDIDLDEITSKKEKVKSKVDAKNDAKIKFQKGRKEIYKHRNKLMDNKQEDDVIIYHDKMTPASLAATLKVSATEIVKKLFNLGIMANLNQTLSFDTVELLLLDYKKMGAKKRRELFSGALLFPFFTVIYCITICFGYFSKATWGKVSRNINKQKITSDTQDKVSD